MTRSDLIEQLALHNRISATYADAVIHEVFNSMADSLCAGNRIEIRGFGSFEVLKYDGHAGRNLKTGLEVVVKPKKLPFFKVGKELKERILKSGMQTD